MSKSLRFAMLPNGERRVTVTPSYLYYMNSFYTLTDLSANVFSRYGEKIASRVPSTYPRGWRPLRRDEQPEYGDGFWVAITARWEYARNIISVNRESRYQKSGFYASYIRLDALDAEILAR